MNKILVNITLVVCFCSCLAIGADDGAKCNKQRHQAQSRIDALLEAAPHMEFPVEHRRFRSDLFTNPYTGKVEDVNVRALTNLAEKALGREAVLREELEKALERESKFKELAAILKELEAKSELLRQENKTLLTMNPLIVDKGVKIP